MRHGRKRQAGVLCTILSCVGTAPARAQQVSPDTGSSFTIVRFDDAQRRVFICARFTQIDTPLKAGGTLKLVQDTVREKRPLWDNEWSTSVFTDAKFVGYKDEAPLEKYLKDGSWRRAYIGEYDRSSQKLTLNPMDPKKTKTMTIRLP